LILACELSTLPSSVEYERAVQVLRDGGIVAYPTETYYGLAVDPLNTEAVAALYRLKNRAPEKALTFLTPDKTTLFQYISYFPAPYTILAKTLWPGPLTLIFTKADNCLLPCKKDDNSLAFRISSHPIAQKLCYLFEDALTASSANISGKPPFRCSEDVKKQWGSQVDYIIDGGKTVGGMPSTIVRLKNNTLEILRSGVVTELEIHKLLLGRYNICKS